MKTCYHVEINREDDGRFLAEVIDLPGVMAYGTSTEDALAHVQALALRVLADQLDHDEGPRGPVSVTFETPEGEAAPLTAAQREDLERRLREMDEHPERGRPWEEVRERLWKRMRG